MYKVTVNAISDRARRFRGDQNALTMGGLFSFNGEELFGRKRRQRLAGSRPDGLARSRVPGRPDQHRFSDIGNLIGPGELGQGVNRFDP